MHLKKCHRVAIYLAALFLSGGLSAQTIKKVPTHCQPDERIQFSCRIGVKTVSLCGGGTDGPLASLTYRYGTLAKIEKEFVARPDNARRFFATVSPAHPGALIQQVWFDQGHLRYLMTVCTGGNCPQGGGLAVLRRDHILMNARCARFGKDDFTLFSPDLVVFSNGVEASRSATEMLVIEDSDNDLDKLFPVKPGTAW